ncbi:LAFE_0G06634g1_1 [Lachancea fermentati]|uniref:LAFE_0G06634g1_1 n=1 Tax=Lachancea fermentati TaxID=4955 RepID=A0A1G4MH71_LACFM|nr:LAFE_0G06634g1_1 [Lachancea fermentati]
MANREGNTLKFQELPTEILIHIFSYLDEKDFYALQESCKQFAQIINDEELWKNLFMSRIHTRLFPSFSRSSKYSIEYVERNRGLSEWRHNRAVKTKYTVATQNIHNQLEKVVFEYPRCACYSDGVIMLVQLYSKRRKDRLTYMPCTTPQGCSTMHFNINAAVFGRYDGRVFGKLLTSKSYLSPVTEFNNMHSSPVTAITTAALEDSSEDWCVSGCEAGQVIWWCGTKQRKALQLSKKPILRLALHKEMTVVLDLNKIYIIQNMENISTLDVPADLQLSSAQIQFFKVDFGGKLLILADTSRLYVMSINSDQDFGFTRSLHFPNSIQNVFIDEATTKKTQDSMVAGGDGCYVGILTRDNSVMTINIRTPGSSLRIQTKLTFQDEVHACQVNNLVLVCAFSGTLGIFDAANGAELRVVRKTEKFPQFLDISHGRMIIGSGNVLHYLQYADSDVVNRKPNSSQRNKSIKWNEVLHSQLDIYEEDERSRQESLSRANLLREKFVGDLDDEELQLKIALMESESLATEQVEVNEDELLRRAIEESRLSFEGNQLIEDEPDEALLLALRQSQEEEERRRTARRAERRMAPLGEFQTPDMSVSSQVEVDTSFNEVSTENTFLTGQYGHLNHDEEMELARALSLSELR